MPVRFQVAPDKARAADVDFLPGGGDWRAVEAQPDPREDGVMVKRYFKDITAAGVFPNTEGGGFAQSREDINHYEAVVTEMLRNGVPITLSKAKSHKEAEKRLPENSAGRLVGAMAVGDILVGEIEVVGEENNTIALANDVSIYAPPEWEDGSANVYQWPITHVLIVPSPAVNGLGGWEAIAASLKKDVGGEEDDGMDWKEIVKAAGLKIGDFKDLSDEDRGPAITAAVKKLGEDHKIALKTATDEAKAAGVEHKKALAEATAKAAAVGAPKAADSNVVTLYQGARGGQIDLLADCATPTITPAVRDGLKALFCSAEPLALSLGSGGPNGDKFDDVLALFALNKPLELAEKTGAQVLTNPVAASVDDRKLGEGLVAKAKEMRDKHEARNVRRVV